MNEALDRAYTWAEVVASTEESLDQYKVEGELRRRIRMCCLTHVAHQYRAFISDPENIDTGLKDA